MSALEAKLKEIGIVRHDCQIPEPTDEDYITLMPIHVPWLKKDKKRGVNREFMITITTVHKHTDPDGYEEENQDDKLIIYMTPEKCRELAKSLEDMADEVEKLPMFLAMDNMS